MLNQVRTLLGAFLGDKPNHGVASPALRRAIEAQAAQLSRDDRATATVLNARSAQLRRTIEAQAAQINQADSPPASASSFSVPTALEAYIRKVTLHADKVTDNDIEALKQAGYSEDELFEITISAAIGAARTRLNVGLAALSIEEDIHAF